MDKSSLTLTNGIYDISHIAKIAVKKSRIRNFHAILYSLLSVAFTALAFFVNSDVVPFILSLAAVAVFVILAIRAIKKIKFSDFKTTHGTISGTHKDITKTYKIKGAGIGAGIGLGGKPKYDKYNTEHARLIIFIEENGKISNYQLDSTLQIHDEYYEIGSEVLHIYGTRYPIRLDFYDKKWLCPMCGAFNPHEKKHCNHCNVKILK